MTGWQRTGELKLDFGKQESSSTGENQTKPVQRVTTGDIHNVYFSRAVQGVSVGSI